MEYSNIKQSLELVKIFSDDGADMYYVNGDGQKIETCPFSSVEHDSDDIPCWSLSAIIKKLPNKTKILCESNNEYALICNINGICYATKIHSNIFDACYELIIMLNS